MARQSKFNFRFRNVITGIYFIASLVVLAVGLLVLLFANNAIAQVIGGAVSAVTALGGMLLRSWRAPVEDIRESLAQQAAIETTFMGFMNRTGQIRLLFQQKYTTTDMSLEDLAAYQKMIADAESQTTQELALIRGNSQK